MRPKSHFGLSVVAFALLGCAMQPNESSFVGYYSTEVVPVQSSAVVQMNPEVVGRFGVKCWIRLDPRGRYESGRQLFWDGQPTYETISALGAPTIPLFEMRGGSKGSWVLLDGRLLLKSDHPVQSNVLPSNFSPEGKSEALVFRKDGAWTIAWGQNEYLKANQPNQPRPTTGTVTRPAGASGAPPGAAGL